MPIICCSIGQRKIFKDKQADGCADRYNDGTLMDIQSSYVDRCIQTDTQRDRQKDRLTYGQRKIFKDKQADGWAGRHNDGRLMDRQS